MCLFCTMNSVTKQFQTFGQKWGESQVFGDPGGTLSYSFADQNRVDQFGTFDSFITEPVFQAEITESLAVWENVADIKFSLQQDSSAVDIRFGWNDIDGKGNVLGRTIVPSFGELSNVIVALDVNEDWFLSGNAPRGKIDFSATAIHEIGHAIGIDHSNSEQAIMHAIYNDAVFDLQQDDIDASVAIYGANTIERIDVHRFFNPNLGGHFFTADTIEKNSVELSDDLRAEGVGFDAISRVDEDIDGSVPVYRFFNPVLGSHFFTGFELEKNSVIASDDFIFEGVGFRAFSADTSSTVPIYRFFNEQTGGHFFTASEVEKTSIEDIPQLRYEGEAFYAFAELNL
jgi:predicted Zn-dependent protease